MPLVYLVDERISHPKSILADIPKTDLGFLITSYMSVAEIVSTITQGLEASDPLAAESRGHSAREATAAPMITGLRIMAYGDSRQVHLGWGIDVRNAVQLTPLAAHMRLGASAECMLFGCNIAVNMVRSERFLGGAAIGQRFGYPGNGWAYDEFGLRESSGYRLIHVLARTLGVPVTTGLDTHAPTPDCHILGATLTVNPDGRATFTGIDTPVLISPTFLTPG
jgi:hypothetical protein